MIDGVIGGRGRKKVYCFAASGIIKGAVRKWESFPYSSFYYIHV